MITGAHTIIYSTNAGADRAFFRDVLGLPSVDVGDGWLIFGLPPAEVAVHPAGANDTHEFYLMCDDVAAFVARMVERGVACAAPQDQGWGILTQVTLPGGGKLGVYQPRHARPEAVAVAKAKPATRKPAKRKAVKPVVKKQTRRVAVAAAASKKQAKRR